MLALKHTYHKNITAEGPKALRATIKGNEVVISFDSAKLFTANQQDPEGFELVTDQGIHIKSKGRIVNDKMIIPIPPNKKIKGVVYGWQPFTHANLVNEVNLPASTFSLAIL